MVQGGNEISKKLKNKKRGGQRQPDGPSRYRIVSYINSISTNNTNIVMYIINSKEYEEILKDRKRNEECKKERGPQI